MIDFLADLTPTLSLLEAVYLAVVGTGWLVVLSEIVNTRHDLQGLRQRKINGARTLSASSRLWDHFALFAAYTFMLSFAIQAAMYPTPPSYDMTRVAAIMISVYMSLSLLSTVSVIWAGRIYKRLIDLLEYRARKLAEQRKAEEPHGPIP